MNVHRARGREHGDGNTGEVLNHGRLMPVGGWLRPTTKSSDTGSVSGVIDRLVERVRTRRREEVPDAVRLPSLVTDLDTLLDVLDGAARTWQSPYEGGETPAPDVRYDFDVNLGRKPTRDELKDLSIHDRNALVANVTVGDQSMQISCPTGNITVNSERASDKTLIESEAIRRLLRGGSWRPTWSRFSPLLPLIPAALVVIGAVMVVVQGGITPAWAVFLGGVVTLLVASAVAWAWRLRTKHLHDHGAIRFRAISRQELYRVRADRSANVKVVLITAPISIAVGVFVAWATGIFESQP